MDTYNVPSYNTKSYNVQSYFKSLCKSYYTAYEQFKRFEKDKQSDDYNFWLSRVSACQNEVKTVIREIAINHILIVISTKEEVFAIIWFFSKHIKSAYEEIRYGFINIAESVEPAYPMEDELCKDFWKEYRLFPYSKDKYTILLSRWEERWK